MRTHVATQPAELAGLLSPLGRGERTSLYLPRFSDGQTHVPGVGSLGYRGGLFTDRDARAALQVLQLLLRVSPSSVVELRHSHDYFDGTHAGRGGFVFGSRSNPVTHHLLAESSARSTFDLQFKSTWEVRWSDGSHFGLPDPSLLEPGEYARHTDYAVLAKLTDFKLGGRVFLLAGLGSRGTEGSAVYLSKFYGSLHERFGSADFALLLAFPDPSDPLAATEVRAEPL